MNFCKRIIEELRRLNIPAKVKAELAILATQAQGLVLSIINFIRRHRKFGEAMVLGAISAFILAQVPLIGSFLSLCALVTAAAIGLCREMKEDLTQAFTTEVPA